MRPRVGLLDLRDLFALPWNRIELDRHLEALELSAGDPAGAFRAFEPPPCLIVVAEWLNLDALGYYAGWLRAARKLIVVREGAPDEAELDDPDMVWLSDEQTREALGEPPPGSLSIIDRKGNDPEPLRRALAEARAAAAEAGDWKADAAAVHSMASLRAGVWLPIEDVPWWSPPHPGEIAHDGRTAFLVESPSRQLPLDGSVPVVVRAGAGPVSPNPDRTAYLQCPERQRGELRAIDGRLLHEFRTMGWMPYGFDPRWPIAWTGLRRQVYWHLARDGRMGMMSPEAHDWPCGHAKKVLGGRDNYPRWIHISPRADAYLSAFDRDVLVSSAVPMYWEERGGIAVARRPAPDPLRALLFTSTEEQRMAWGATLTDEDARAEAPPVVLGTDDGARYAVGIERETFRLRGATLEQLSARGGGFAVYDGGHGCVRVATGRLLGGWDGVATVEHERQLFREELATGARRSLGPSDRPITRALPIAGTENVLLVGEETRAENTKTTHVRVV